MVRCPERVGFKKHELVTMLVLRPRDQHAKGFCAILREGEEQERNSGLHDGDHDHLPSRAGSVAAVGNWRGAALKAAGTRPACAAKRIHQ